ncbi:hypothetical protein JRQ81_003910, partial [Phrynocephalus forsythii]
SCITGQKISTSEDFPIESIAATCNKSIKDALITSVYKTGTTLKDWSRQKETGEQHYLLWPIPLKYHPDR